MNVSVTNTKLNHIEMTVNAIKTSLQVNLVYERNVDINFHKYE